MAVGPLKALASTPVESPTELGSTTTHAPLPTPTPSDGRATMASAPSPPPLLAACSTPEELQRDYKARTMRPWAHSTLSAGALYTAPSVVTHPGDPSYGTLTTVRIQHLRPENDAAAMAAGLVSEAAALGYLEAHAAKHVFAEGVVDEPPRDRERIREQVTAVFRDWRPGDAPNDRQLSALIQLGAARIYALRHRDVTLHAVTTHAESEADDAHFNQCRAAGLFANIAVVFDGREERLIRRLGAFFEDNPGAQAIVVFGAHHDFGRHVSPSFNPRVVEVQLTP